MNLQTHIRNFLSALERSLAHALLSVRLLALQKGEKEKWNRVCASASEELLPLVYESLNEDDAPDFFTPSQEEWRAYFRTNATLIRNFLYLLDYLPLEILQTLPSYFSTEGEEPMLPRQLAELLLFSVQTPKGSLYCPNDGSGQLLQACLEGVKAQGMTVCGHVPSFAQLKETKALLEKEQILFDFGEIPSYPLADSSFSKQKFDCILANPPFNLAEWNRDGIRYDDPRFAYGVPPRSNANFAWLQHALFHLKDGGRAAIILPNNTLYSNKKEEKLIRKNLVQAGVIEGIITFPKGLFQSANTAFCIWLLHKAEHKTLLLLDGQRLSIKKDSLTADRETIVSYVQEYRTGKLSADPKWCAVVRQEEIANKDYDLSPYLYLPSRYPLQITGSPDELRRETEKLLASDPSPALRKGIEDYLQAEPSVWQEEELLNVYDIVGGVSKKGSSSSFTPLLNVKQVIGSPFVSDPLKERIAILQTEKAKYDLRYGDVFINRCSETEKEIALSSVALKEFDGVFSCWLKRLRPYAERLYPPYAAAFFRSQIYRKQVMDNLPLYSTRVNINNDLFEKIRIYFPDERTQRIIGDLFYALCNEETDERKTFCRLFLSQAIDLPASKNFKIGRTE